MTLRCLSACVSLAAAVVATPAAAVSAASAAPEAQTWTTIEHDVTLEAQAGEDELCGRGGITETMVNKLQMQHLTENVDGSFHFVDFETGKVVIDFDDPAYDDLVFRRTESFHFNVTPGETVTLHENLRDSNGDITFVYRFHLAMVDGEPVVEREVEQFRWNGSCG